MNCTWKVTSHFWSTFCSHGDSSWVLLFCGSISDEDLGWQSSRECTLLVVILLWFGWDPQTLAWPRGLDADKRPCFGDRQTVRDTRQIKTQMKPDIKKSRNWHTLPTFLNQLRSSGLRFAHETLSWIPPVHFRFQWVKRRSQGGVLMAAFTDLRTQILPYFHSLKGVKTCKGAEFTSRIFDWAKASPPEQTVITWTFH